MFYVRIYEDLAYGVSRRTLSNVTEVYKLPMLDVITVEHVEAGELKQSEVADGWVEVFNANTDKLIDTFEVAPKKDK